MLALAFRVAGYQVEIAANANEAMAHCDAGPFEAVISDVTMPGMDGHEFAQWLAGRFPATRTILMTGYDGGCLNCPYSPRCLLLHKPFRPAEALELVRRVLSSGATPEAG
jgi:DNA-binding NtrC family response regulator